MSTKRQEDEQPKVTPYWIKMNYVTMERATRRATPEEIGTAVQRCLAVWNGTMGEDEAYDGLNAKTADALDVLLESLEKSRESFTRQSKVGKENREKVGQGKSKKSKKAPEVERDEAEQATPEQPGPIKYAAGTDEHYLAHALADWIAGNTPEGKRAPRWSESELDGWADVIHKAAARSKARAPIDIAEINEALYWAVVQDTPDRHPNGGKWHGWSSVIKSGARLLDKGSNGKAKIENIIEAYHQNQAKLYHNMEVQNDVELW